MSATAHAVYCALIADPERGECDCRCADCERVDCICRDQAMAEDADDARRDAS